MNIFSLTIKILTVFAFLNCYSIKEKPKNNEQQQDISKKEAICCCTDLWNYCFYFEPSIKYSILKNHKLFLTQEEYKKVLSKDYFYYVYTVNTKNNEIIDFKTRGLEDSVIEEKIRRYVLENVGFTYKIFKDNYKMREKMNLSGDIHINKLLKKKEKF